MLSLQYRTLQEAWNEEVYLQTICIHSTGMISEQRYYLNFFFQENGLILRSSVSQTNPLCEDYQNLSDQSVEGMKVRHVN